ncbi:MAG: hypothetical protein EZS28_031221 [Streblomastix strix]|uniref:Uncharacterized protein n=1 Tax=Streblomastix strix TaxID=222440 RepID=A0A5J4UT37_9EUKA|nr:MAG: hypothetical protein EZS28_031221 [Streblomastix strix]
MRPYGPDTRRLLNQIQNAIKDTARRTTFYYSGINLSGESENQVRIWKICRDTLQFIAEMKDLIVTVTAVYITKDYLECVNSRSDGQLPIRQLNHYIRLKKMINIQTSKEATS